MLFARGTILGIYTAILPRAKSAERKYLGYKYPATIDTFMFERLNQIEKRYEELTQALASPETISDSAKYQKTAKAHSEIT